MTKIIQNLGQGLVWLLLVSIWFIWTIEDLPQTVRKNKEKLKQLAFNFGGIVSSFMLLYGGGLLFTCFKQDGTIWDMFWWMIDHPLPSGLIFLGLAPFIIFFLKDAIPYARQTSRQAEQSSQE